MSEFIVAASVEHACIKEHWLAKKKEVEWKQKEERLLFSEYVRVSKNYADESMRGCARHYFEEWRGLIQRLHNHDKLSKKEKDTLEVYRSIFCESFFPESMREIEITAIWSYGYEDVGKEFYFSLNGKKYGIYIPNPDSVNERNFTMFGGDVTEFSVMEHEDCSITVLLHTHDLDEVKKFLEGLNKPIRKGRPKKDD